MEKIKVNMSPNPLDVQTIHASQNDGEAREWEFELHNNGEKIDSSSISDQLVFKAYKGGTEQLLPENTSTPTTSPFKGDIKYSQGLLTDQEFTYRQSPTEEDGLAKITDIKGNTIVWNQLVQNGNFESTSGWATDTNYGSIAVANNVLTYTVVQIYNGTWYNRVYCSLAESIDANHKLLIKMRVDATKNFPLTVLINAPNGQPVNRVINITSSQKEYSIIANTAVAGANTFATIFNLSSGYSVGDTLKLGNIQVFDLTQMGLDITDPSGFTSLFPLSYYSYNQGSLLSFNGNGIKTVGFNQWDEEWEVGSLNASDGSPINTTNQIRSKNFCRCLSGQSYYFRSSKTDGGNENIYYFAMFFYDANQNFVSRAYSNNAVFTAPTGASYFKFTSNSGGVIYGNSYLNDICISISSSRNGEYEPYTETITDLPISAYFPTGMKRAGNIYDELTENKATQRLVYYKITGNETVNRWVDNTSTAFGNHYGGALNIPSLANCMFGGNAIGLVSKGYQLKFANENKTIYLNSNGNLAIIDDSYTTQSAWLEGIKDLEVVFALRSENYVETSFTTASLVTENAEIPLSNEDGVLIGKCTEQLSENPGFFDAKIKLSDSDGECYSNKIQLHVERSPQ